MLGVFMTRKQSLWLFIWIFIFFLFFCLWNKLPRFVANLQRQQSITTSLQKETTSQKDMHFKIFKNEQTIILSGVVSDEETKAKIIDAYGKNFPQVESDDIEMDATVDNQQIVAFFTNIAETFSQFDSGYLSYENHTLEIDGLARHNIIEKRLDEAISELTNITIDNKLTLMMPAPKQLEENLSPVVQNSKVSSANAIQQEIDALLKKERVQFLYARDILTTASQKLVDEIIKILKANPYISLYIEGHTDSDGTEENNLKLSQRRANSVKAYMVKEGIDAHRLYAIGYGESRPLVPNDSLKNREKNRRVEFIVKGE
jgi:outer membrane protein OmpA-like peptidoglycan-associated protein